MRDSPARFSLSSKDFDTHQDFDSRLTEAIDKIHRTLPNELEIVLGYLKSMALTMPLDPSNEECVKAAYHQKSYVVQIVRRLNGLDRI